MTNFSPRRKQKSWRLAAPLCALLLASLACNLPRATPTPSGLSEEDLRATLAAQLAPTETPVGAPTALPTAVVPTLAQDAVQPSPFPGLHTATPPSAEAGAPPPTGTAGSLIYISQSGDTLLALAERFAVDPAAITSADPIDPQNFLPPGQTLEIPNILGESRYPSALLPDSEVINSPSAFGFDLRAFAASAGGYLTEYGEYVTGGEYLDGIQIVERVALEQSVNPRLLLAILEQRSGWVLGRPAVLDDNFPIGFHIGSYRGLYLELSLAATHLNLGYYGWRQGLVTELKFRDKRLVRISPQLNAGSAGLQYLYAKLYDPGPWEAAIYGPQGLLALHAQMFGDSWARAFSVEPLLPAGLAQPELALPFPPGERWSFTGGPHASWNTGTPPGAIDFAPATGGNCKPSSTWVLASAPGVVTRSNRKGFALDLDGDGHEGTGWVLIYMHLAERDRLPVGTRVERDDPIGHPSCEGGRTTGTHVHIARKVNGEWLSAAGPLPFNLEGWVAEEGPRSYEGSLRKSDQVVSAHPGGPGTSIIVR